MRAKGILAKTANRFYVMNRDTKAKLAFGLDAKRQVVTGDVIA